MRRKTTQFITQILLENVDPIKKGAEEEKKQSLDLCMSMMYTGFRVFSWRFGPKIGVFNNTLLKNATH